MYFTRCETNDFKDTLGMQQDLGLVCIFKMLSLNDGLQSILK